MNKKPVLLGSLILSLFVVSSTATAATMTFSDVNAQTEYLPAINWAVSAGVASGYADGTWKPRNCVNRAELIKMVMQAKGQGGATVASSYTTPFPDIQKTDWYYAYANNARVSGYIQGYADGFFRGWQCVNRAEAMKIATNVMFNKPQLDTGTLPLYFDNKMVVDIKLSDWFMPYARFLFADRLVGTNHTRSAGTTSETVPPVPQIYFYPAGEMTRMEVAQMLYLIVNSTKYNAMQAG